MTIPWECADRDEITPEEAAAFVIDCTVCDILDAIKAAETRLGDYLATLPEGRRINRYLWRADMHFLADALDDIEGLYRPDLHEHALKVLRDHGELNERGDDQ